MQTTIDQQRYVKGRGRIIVVAIAMILLSVIFCSPTLACIKVYEVSIYAGKTQEEADEHEYDGEIMYIPIDSEAYFYAEIDDVCNPDWKDFEWKFDFDSDGIWDYNTLTYWLEYIPPNPPNPWTYDTAGWYYPRVKVGLEDVPDSDAEDTCQVAVVTVTNLVWQTYPGNTPLAGGKIFPGKKTYDDPNGPDRRKVKVKATLNMAPDASDNIGVIFKRWDVDDPSADSAPIDENDNDPDPNKHSMDNKGSSCFENGYDSAGDLADGSVVYATFLVSMRPGDNYRITATTSQEAKDELTHYKVETGNIPSSVKRTSILTTWRKLHIEFDTMDAPPSNEPFGTITGTSSFIGMWLLVDNSDPDWPDGSLNGGVLDPEDNNPGTTVDYVNENTFEVDNNDNKAVTIRHNYTYDRFDNDGTNGIDDEGEDFDMSKYAADPSNEPYGINTDDKEWKTADLPVPDTSTIISGMNGYYDDAFIKVEEQTTGNTHNTFPWHRAPIAQLATADVPGDSRYWAACVGWGYEKELRNFFTCPANCEDHKIWYGDNDPQNEGVPPGHGGVSGGTAEGIIAERCMIWLESIREVSASIQKIVSHEVGHLFGLEHSEYDPATGFEETRDGIMGWKDNDMRDYTCIKEWFDLLGSHTSPNRFSDQHINDLRDWVND